MVRLNFPEYRPDVSDLNAEYTRHLSNVVPRADGYGPFKDLVEFTGSLPFPCRGGIVARQPDSTVTIIAGTATGLYILNNTTLQWVLASKDGGPYGELSSDANWVFTQFGNRIVATQKGADPQVLDITSDSEFDNLAGSPPRAGHCSVIGNFLVLSDLVDDPNRVEWSGLNDPETWDGSKSSDFQDIADGGRVRCTVSVGGDVGLILQDSAVRRMAWAPGDERVFLIDKIENADGVLAPYSVVTTLGGAAMLSPRGFIMIDGAGAISPIGEERVNRTFLGQHGPSAPGDVRDQAYDDTNAQLVIAASDPKRPIVVWAYKSQSGNDALFDRAFVYHTILKRWAPLELSGEYLLQVAQPGLTLEALDAIAPGSMPITGAANNGSGLIRITVASTASLTTGDFKTLSAVGGVPNANGTWEITVINGTTFDLVGSTFAGTYTSGGIVGGSLDLLSFSLDDVSTATLPAFAGVSSTHALGFYSGANLQALLTTSEQSLGRRRMNINGFRPITDANVAFGCTLTRERLNGEATEWPESEMDDQGWCPRLDEGRYARGRLRIPAATDWTFATGVEDVDAQPGGEL